MIARARRATIQWPMVLWLAVVWVFLWGDISVGNIIVGVVLGLIVTLALPLPRVAYSGKPNFVGIVKLVARFLLDVVLASAEVTKLALLPGRTPLEAVIAVPMRSKSDLYMTITAELVSLVPGSLIVESQAASGMLYVHFLDVRGSAGVESARHAVWDQEARVLRALASSEELVAAGFPPRRRRAGSTAEVSESGEDRQ